MSNLRAGDHLEVRLIRKIKGKPTLERVALDADDVRFMSTPELLRTFAGAIENASQRLDIAEEYATKGREDEGDPWCEPCQSWHPRPRDPAHHKALKCFAPFEEASSS